MPSRIKVINLVANPTDRGRRRLICIFKQFAPSPAHATDRGRDGGDTRRPLYTHKDRHDMLFNTERHSFYMQVERPGRIEAAVHLTGCYDALDLLAGLSAPPQFVLLTVGCHPVTPRLPLTARPE